MVAERPTGAAFALPSGSTNQVKGRALVKVSFETFEETNVLSVWADDWRELTLNRQQQSEHESSHPLEPFR